MDVASLPVPAVAGMARCARGRASHCPVRTAPAVGGQEQSLDGLGSVHGAAAAQGNQAVAALGQVHGASRGAVLKVRVGMEAGEHRVGMLPQRLGQGRAQAVGADGQRFAHPQFFQHCRDLCQGTHAAGKLLYHAFRNSFT